MLKKPFIAPVLTEFGRFEEIVLGEGNPNCGSHVHPNREGDNLVCDDALGGEPGGQSKPAPFCDAWAICGSS